MIQIHKSITLTPFHPTNGGMNAYKNFPSGQRRVLSNDNRFTPIATGKERNTWEPFYGLTATSFSDSDTNGVPGVFGETFNVENIPHQIITNGVVEMPTDKYFAVPEASGVWDPGAILVLIPSRTTGWSIGKVEPIVGSAGTETKYSNQQIGVLLTPIVWEGVSAGSIKPKQPTVTVLVGYSKIPKKIVNAQAVKAAPLAAK